MHPAPPLPAPAPLDDQQAYEALRTRDARFDGRFFVGVSSTGIYCRPVCRVRLPKPQNCRFFAHAAAAEQAGFRPCLRCRPELAPGLALADACQTLAEAAARRIQAAVAAGQELTLPHLAGALGITERHLRRVFQQRFGVSPLAWWTTQRLLLAKQLLTDTALPMAEVAAASGFGSVRRFNACLAQHYRLTPSALRRAGPRRSDTPSLFLPWRAPYEHQAMLDFLGARPLRGVAHTTADGWWCRSLALDWQAQRLSGWLALRMDPAAGGVHLRVAPALAPALGTVLGRVRHLLDLDADPQCMAPSLRQLPAPARPGLRVPGSLDGFETTVRIILGQQVSVAAACTLATRLVQALGEPCASPWPEVDRLFPTVAAVAQACPEHLGTLGIARRRVQALQAVAAAVQAGALRLQPDADLQHTLHQLRALPGVGDWTAELVALRVLAWPDAFPASDAGVLRALGHRSPSRALAQSEHWRPWRAYAVMQLWQAPPAATNKAACP